MNIIGDTMNIMQGDSRRWLAIAKNVDAGRVKWLNTPLILRETIERPNSLCYACDALYEEDWATHRRLLDQLEEMFGEDESENSIRPVYWWGTPWGTDVHYAARRKCTEQLHNARVMAALFMAQITKGCSHD